MYMWTGRSAGSNSLLEGVGSHVGAGHEVGQIDPPHPHHVPECLSHFIGIAWYNNH